MESAPLSKETKDKLNEESYLIDHRCVESGIVGQRSEDTKSGEAYVGLLARATNGDFTVMLFKSQEEIETYADGLVTAGVACFGKAN